MLNANRLILRTVCLDNAYLNLSTDNQHLTMQLITSENDCYVISLSLSDDGKKLYVFGTDKYGIDVFNQYTII